MSAIAKLTALEILDSRGRPTVQATCVLAQGQGASGTASVPSGASTGTAEARELRDGDPARYGGLGCQKAVQHIEGEIRHALVGRESHHQADLDRALCELDGTRNKSRLGANAILAVSLAFSRALASERQVPLYRYYADLVGERARTLPRPTINLFSGGKHAGQQVGIQDVLVVPQAATTMADALAVTAAVYQAAIQLTARKYAARALAADEGGLAPNFPDSGAMLADAQEAIEAAGFKPGGEVALAVDCASSHFFEKNLYHLDGRTLDSRSMVEMISGWVDRYPLLSVEDGLAEEDWSNWPGLCAQLGSRVMVLGDDLLCSNPDRIRRAIADRAANALLLKVNQIGTLTEAAVANRLAREAGWRVTVSARSGETEDHWLADLAVGWSGQQIKIGSITRSERLAKYNRLLAIEKETGFPLAS
jgi:enolase